MVTQNYKIFEYDKYELNQYNEEKIKMELKNMKRA